MNRIDCLNSEKIYIGYTLEIYEGQIEITQTKDAISLLER